MRHRLSLALVFGSGFAGLGYQIVWSQQCALWLGHEAAAVLAVVTAFFGGLGLGALLLAGPIARSTRPERWYAACELAIAAWALVLALLLAPVSEALLTVIGALPHPVWQWGVAFVGSFIVLLPATAAMGATLPAMERVTAPLGASRAQLAALYAGNTLGAVLGVLATAFWLLPELGLARTVGVCALLNLACACAALRLERCQPIRPALRGETEERGRLRVLAATGLLGIGYEVLVVRVLSQVAEDTVYTFALLLAVYLVGSAVGAAAYQRSQGRVRDAALLGERLLCLQALACLMGTLALYASEPLQQVVRRVLGASFAAALAGEAALALAAFALPTLVMGALFSHLGAQARERGHGFGVALGFNTLGAAAAPLLFGMVLLPALGAKAALLLVAAGYLALAVKRGGSLRLGWATACALLLVALWAPPLAFVDVPDGGRVVYHVEGALAAVSVVEDADGTARLRINNRQQEGSSATLLADARQALLPLLLHPAPQRALFLGLGTGVTASAAAQDPALQVDAVELLPEVIAASAHFSAAVAGGPPRLHAMAADARRFVRTSAERYDVIVADNFHPARSGSGALYTVEHFRAVHDRLAPGGLFCQWLPLHQLDLDTVRSIARSFLAVYPRGWAMVATYSLETPVLGLVAQREGERLHLVELRERLAHAGWPWSLAEYGIADEFALLGGTIAGPRALARFAGDATLNTDDRPVVAYRAPRITYAPDSLPRERLTALLREMEVQPEEVVDAGGDAAWQRRMAAYWQARDRFIDAGQGVRPSSDVQGMLAQVRVPLLEALRTSPEFGPAYDPLWRMAAALAASNPSAARTLAAELVQIQPARAEARRLLESIDARGP